ncbi:MAG TPA: biosynthetic peptidoglycan transglycosylase [Gemmatimonadales bacterium]|jgi:monofunctional biosynthetic peptidoglycan transglycosylase
MGRAMGVLGAVAGVFLLWLLAIWPPPSWFRTHWPRQTAFMTRRPASPLSPEARKRGRLYRPVPLDSIAPAIQDAVMIGEDSRFLTHGGIDYVALAQALGYPRETFDWNDPRQRQELFRALPNAWSRRDKLRGASTITQQLAKNLYLSPSRNPLRKLKEAVISWRLESALGKRRIMELYLNLVELGEDVWGVEAASQLYFKRNASGISQEEAAALAGALPFPRSSNPLHRPGRMRWRQSLILRRMRGEQVEVPTTEHEEPEVVPPGPPAPDGLPDSAATDSTLLDSMPQDSLADHMPPSDSAVPDSEPAPPDSAP